MRPFSSFLHRLPDDFRCALRCLGMAALVLVLALSPLEPATAAEAESVAVSLDLSLLAFSDDLQLELLARVLAAEVGDRSYAAQVAYGAMLINRLADPRFPGELGAVVGDAGLRAAVGEIPTRSLRAAKAALMGVDPTAGALYCYTDGGHEGITAVFDGLAFGK